MTSDLSIVNGIWVFLTGLAKVREDICWVLPMAYSVQRLLSSKTQGDF
jgi:hypothetical protein